METEFHHYYYSLVESIPVPKLTWSTTAPAVLCPAPPEDALLEFEWAAENEGQAWWVGFLKSLDCKSGNGAQENTTVAVESCKEATATAPAMDPSGTFPEDWLCFPAAEDHGDQPAA
nr:hypothetical protein CDL12_00911 [Ipomoea batatas]GMC85899.1 hypothetical protein CDL12_00911 [Ipomoea batatas]